MVPRKNHTSESDEEFTVHFDDLVILTELRWEVRYSSPQIDEIVLLEVDQPPPGHNTRPWFTPNAWALEAGPFPVGSDIRIELSDDLQEWEEIATYWQNH